MTNSSSVNMLDVQKNMIRRMIDNISTNKPTMTTSDIDGKRYTVFENSLEKTVVGFDYNYVFNKTTGAFARWGKTIDEDPEFSPIGPEIADVEISTDSCSGGCHFCYKGNTNGPGKQMTLNTWKILLSKLPKNLTQVAFGITDLNSNPDFMAILKHTREQGVIPNFTTHGMYLTEEMAKEFASVCGAIAVSAYVWNKDACYNAVKMLTDAGMTQINIHLVVSEQLQFHAKQVLQDRLSDPRLSKLNAIVFLGMKPKGRAANKSHDTMEIPKYQELIDFALKNNISFGFDSCSAQKFENAIKGIEGISQKDLNQMIQSSEGCESDSFSIYVNVDGIAWHCSFTEDDKAFTGIDVLKSNDFFKDIWYSKSVINFRERSINTGKKDGCRKCIVFPSINVSPYDKLEVPVYEE